MQILKNKKYDIYIYIYLFFVRDRIVRWLGPSSVYSRKRNSYYETEILVINIEGSSVSVGLKNYFHRLIKDRSLLRFRSFDLHGNGDNISCSTPGCLRNKKYTQSKCTPSSMAAVINASAILYGPVSSSSERRRCWQSSRVSSITFITTKQRIGMSTVRWAHTIYRDLF